MWTAEEKNVSYSCMVELAATDKSQNKTKQNEFCARRDKLMVGTTLQVVFKGTETSKQRKTKVDGCRRFIASNK